MLGVLFAEAVIQAVNQKHLPDFGCDGARLQGLSLQPHSRITSANSAARDLGKWVMRITGIFLSGIFVAIYSIISFLRMIK